MKIYRITTAALKSLAGFLAGLGMAAIFTGCAADESWTEPSSGNDGINFGAVIGGPDKLETRANDNIYNITTEFYNCKYHIFEEGYNYDDEKLTDVSTYVIPAGYEAIIQPDYDEKKLDWFSRTGDHDFWCVTTPHDPTFDPASVEHPEEGVPLVFEDTYLSGTTSSSAGTWRDDSWKNGKPLMQLIGAHSGTFNYNDQGMFVPLRFRHLVSMIIISKFYVVDNISGTTDETLKGHITFYGMPRNTTLHVSPRGEDGTPKAPYVAIPENWDYDPSEGVTYAICNSGLGLRWEGYDPHYYASTMWRDCWLIPPELDFSQLSFKIEIYEYQGGEWVLSQTHGKHGAYYGDFRNVTFSRSGNSGYNDTENPGSDVTTLHAGEYLSLTINLYEKGNPVIHGSIIDWTSSSTDRAGSAHVQQGIYSIDELRDLSSVMASGDEELIKSYFELYGSGRNTGDDPEGEYPDYEAIFGKELEIFELFDDLGNQEALSSITSSTTKASDCIMGDGYILDGRGHTIEFNSASGKIGPMRDVYLRHYYYDSYAGVYPYPRYEYMLYIDKMGNVYTVDVETFEMTPTGNNVLEPDYENYTIYLNFHTGNFSRYAK